MSKLPQTFFLLSFTVVFSGLNNFSTVPGLSPDMKIEKIPERKDIKGLRIEVADKFGKPLSGFAIYYLRTVNYHTEYDRCIEDKYKFSYSMEPVIEAYKSSAIEHYNELLLRQNFDRNHVASGIFSSVPMIYSESNSYTREVQFWDLQDPLEYLLYHFYIVIKPGYYPEVVVFNSHEQQAGEWMTVQVILTPWLEKQAELLSKPWLLDNISLVQEKQTPRISFLPRFEKRYGAWYDRLEQLQKTALLAHDRRSAAELELAKAVGSKQFKKIYGWYNDGGENNTVTGEIWKAGVRANQIDPTWREAQAAVRMLELNRQLKWTDYNHKKNPNDDIDGGYPLPKISMGFILNVIKDINEFSDNPFIQDNILNFYTRIDHWEEYYDSQETFKLLLEKKIGVKLEIARQHPSSLWFGMDYGASRILKLDAQFHGGKFFWERDFEPSKKIDKQK